MSYSKPPQRRSENLLALYDFYPRSWAQWLVKKRFFYSRMRKRNPPPHTPPTFFFPLRVAPQEKEKSVKRGGEGKLPSLCFERVFLRALTNLESMLTCLLHSLQNDAPLPPLLSSFFGGGKKGEKGAVGVYCKTNNNPGSESIKMIRGFKTRSLPPQQLQVLWTLFSKFFCNFPSRYLYAIDLPPEYLALDGVYHPY